MKSVLLVLLPLVMCSLTVYCAPTRECDECGCPALLGSEEKSVCRHLLDLRDQVEAVASEVERRTPHIGRLADLEEKLDEHLEWHLLIEETTSPPPATSEAGSGTADKLLMERLATLEAEFRRHLRREETSSPATDAPLDATEAALFGSGTVDTLLEDGLKEAHKEIRQLKQRLDSQEVLYKNLLKAVEDMKKKNEMLPFPQPFVSNVEDNMLGDSGTVGLTENVSHLLAKVEKVENMTSEVQEELKSERRVRRHLEEDLNATRHDVRLLNDKFEMTTHDLVEELVNMTLFEKGRNGTRDISLSDQALRFEEELQSLSDALTEMRENASAARLALGASRVNALEARAAEVENATAWIRTGMEGMRGEIHNIHSALAVLQLGERLTRSEIRNLTSEVLAPLYHRVSLMHEELADVERRVDSLETDHTLKECGDPLPTPDPHLLIFLDVDSSGRRGLVFGCRPPGAYALVPSTDPVTCVSGQWVGRMPECKKLPEEQEIEAMEVTLSEPCAYSFGPEPDPSDCASYLECGLGVLGTSRRCPGGLLFDPDTRSCEPAHLVRCQTADLLADLVPPIVVEPATVDQPYSLMGTGPRGELVVHPRTSLVLHCLYPGRRGDEQPVWRKIQGGSAEDLHSAAVGSTRHSIRIPGASGGDSGVYECVTPRGRTNRVTLVVKSVVCPPLPYPASYRPHPEGESRVLSTLAEFRCGNGSTATVMCTAAGTWSTTECDPDPDSFPWDCPPLAAGPSLLVDLSPSNARAVDFRCASSTSRLVGPAYTRCQEDGQWTHGQLPKCHPFADQ